MKNTRNELRLRLASLVLLCTCGLCAAEPETALTLEQMQADPGTRVTEEFFGKAYEFNGKGRGGLAQTGKSAEEWIAKYRKTSDGAIGLYIRFDGTSQPAAKQADSNFGLFDCVLTPEGRIAFTYYAAPTDFLGPSVTAVSRDTFEPGQWLHIEFAYSDNRKRVFLHVNGQVQFENDNLDLPGFAVYPFRVSGSFAGAIGGLRFYNLPLHTEYLRPVSVTAADFDACTKQLDEARNAAENTSLKGLLESLKKELASLRGKKILTKHEWEHLKTRIGNACAVAAKLPSGGGVKSGIVTAFTVKPMSQEAYLPYALPEAGVLNGKLSAVAALGEYEPVSFLVFPFAPVKKFEVVLSDLKGPGGAVFPVSAMDPKLIKRQYCSGGAWLSYHADKRLRILTPVLLLNDDDLIHVDEFTQTNHIRLSYPEGDVYVDASRNADGLQLFNYQLPFRDADCLQPLTLPEAGRNQQFFITYHVPENQTPGTYRGQVRLMADGREAGRLDVSLLVLPFTLPEARTYYDPDKIFYGNFSHKIFNGNPPDDVILAQCRDMISHNMLYPTFVDPARDAETFARHVKLRKQAGLPHNVIFSGSSGIANLAKIPLEKRTKEVFEREVAVFSEYVEKVLSAFEKEFGHRNVYMYGFDEASYYGTLVNTEIPGFVAVKQRGGKIRASGGANNETMTSDVQDMMIQGHVVPKSAKIWHAAGGTCLNYANPFPSEENPLMFRIGIGQIMYFSEYDGTMMHGYNVITRFNGFAKDWEANYRHFSMVYPQQHGVIDTLGMEGIREAFDDVRYFSLMQLLARKAMGSKEIELSREGKRSMVWLASVKPNEDDPDTLRLQTIERIMNLRKLMQKYGVK